MLLCISNHFSFTQSGFREVGAMHRMKQFYRAKVRILQERFGKDSYISRTEAKQLAETLNLQPEQVLGWFGRQRGTGRVVYRMLKKTLV